MTGLDGLGNRLERLETLRRLKAMEANRMVAISADPAAWVADRIGEHLWSKQTEICNSVREHRYTAVQSCHDAGKSYIASRIAAWWISHHPPGEAFVVSTAPTAAQVYAILWREITKAHTKGKLPGRIVTSGFPQWKLDTGELVGYGRKPADYEQSAFQGIHARYVLIIMDEACGIDRNLFDSVDALATNEDARVLAIGNPDDPASHFASVCRRGSGWNTIRIDGLRTPNFTKEQIEKVRCTQCESGGADMLWRLMDEEKIQPVTEEVPDDLRPFLLSPLWVEERLHRWVGKPGVTEDGKPESLASKAALSPLFTAKVRGLFPDVSSNSVIPLGWVERAIERWHEWVANGKPEPRGRRVIGVDVAREGEDETCLFTRTGVAGMTIDRFSSRDTMEITGLVRSKLAYPKAFTVVDVIGIGAGVVDRLREQRMDVIAFNAAKATERTDRTGEFKFNNCRSAAWWNLRELLDPSADSKVMLPDDEMLVADLTAPNWRVHSGGRIVVESKDEIRKRLGRSTDTGDACVQAWWIDGGVLGSESGSSVDRAVPWSTNDSDDWDERDAMDAVPWKMEEV